MKFYNYVWMIDVSTYETLIRRAKTGHDYQTYRKLVN